MGNVKNTVKAALRSDGRPRYERPLRGSVVDEVEPRVRELLQAFPTMPATVIAERFGLTVRARTRPHATISIHSAQVTPRMGDFAEALRSTSSGKRTH